MVTIKGGDKFDKYMADLARQLSDGQHVNVGFLEGATYPDGTPVATVAAVQNFGSPAMGIPPRPFFTNMIAAKSGGWGDSLARILALEHMNTRRALKKLGLGIVGQLQTSIYETNDPPLAEETIRRKGFSKPLIDTSVMWNSVDSEVV